MSVTHHPNETLLLGYGVGSLDTAMSLLVATHLCFCPQCRDFVRAAEKIGGALLNDIPAVAMQSGALSATLARLTKPEAETPAAVVSNDNTPPPLRAFLGQDLSTLRWHRVGPKLGYKTLYRRSGRAIRLLRGAPGSDVGRHTHRGEEYTLVLRGGYSDETGHYTPGDFQEAAAGDWHNPIADAGEDCINLAVTTGGLRFEGAVQNLVGRLFGF